MTSQPRHISAIESVTNVAVGFGLALVTQAVLFPVFDIHAAPGEHAAIAAVFTVISLVRSYTIRRVFVWVEYR